MCVCMYVCVCVCLRKRGEILTKTLNEVGWKSWGALVFMQQSAYGEMLTRKLEHEVKGFCIMEGGMVAKQKV